MDRTRPYQWVSIVNTIPSYKSVYLCAHIEIKFFFHIFLTKLHILCVFGLKSAAFSKEYIFLPEKSLQIYRKRFLEKKKRSNFTNFIEIYKLYMYLY